MKPKKTRAAKGARPRFTPKPLDVESLIADRLQKGRLEDDDCPAILNGLLGDNTAFPARRNITVSGARSRGLFNSYRFEKMLAWESSLERALLLLVEFSCLPALIHAQPARLELRGPEGTITYTPDFLIVDHAGVVHLVECKPKKEFDLPEVKARFDAIQLILESAGIRFHRVDDKQLFHEHRFKNALNLARFRDLPERRASSQILCALVEGVSSYAELVAAYGDRAVLRSIANRLVYFNFSEPLNGATQLLTFARSHDDAASFLFN